MESQSKKKIWNVEQKDLNIYILEFTPETLFYFEVLILNSEKQIPLLSACCYNGLTASFAKR